MSVKEEAKEKAKDFQLWLILPERGLIQNKQTGMYLTTDFDGNVRTLEGLSDDSNFNRWILLHADEKFSASSNIIKTPFGTLSITENTNLCKSHLV